MTRCEVLSFQEFMRMDMHSRLWSRGLAVLKSKGYSGITVPLEDAILQMEGKKAQASYEKLAGIFKELGWAGNTEAVARAAAQLARASRWQWPM